jgi:hypothetical protein
MAFTTLAERYEQRSKDIYSKFQPSSGQPVTIRPTGAGNPAVLGGRNFIKYDTRALPIISVARDTLRLSNFFRTNEGVLFLAKQLLLQTGNTFENTKVLNPLSFLLNVTPHTFRFRRHIESDRTAGYLQTYTIKKLATPSESSGLASRLAGARSISAIAGAFAQPNLASAQITEGWGGNRPEFSAFAKDGKYFGPNLYPLNAKTIRSVPDASPNRAASASFGTQKVEYVNKFYDAPEKINTDRLQSSYLEYDSISDVIPETPDQIRSAVSRKTKIRDVYNIITTPVSPEEDASSRVLNYNRFKTPKDIIRFGFSYIKPPTRVTAPTSPSTNGGGSGIIGLPPAVTLGQNLDKPMFFRAFLKRIKENIKPEFNEQRYVGRTERFVTYGGAKRSTDLEFIIAAFSKDEADGMWTKINYLTGLAFPLGVSNGFLIPPLFAVSIGEIYDNQPCYIEVLDYTFLDEATTFDIDKEVPFSISVNMRLSLLEKRSKFYNTPFYKITEGQLNSPSTQQGRPTTVAGAVEQFNRAEQDAADQRLAERIARRANYSGITTGPSLD